MRTQQKLRSCREEPREYPFSYTIANALEQVPNLAQKLDQDAVFSLREVVPVTASGYRYQIFDPARMPLEDSPIDPYYEELIPTVTFPPAGMILITVEDISGNPGTVVSLLFRGVNRYSDYREPEKPQNVACIEMPRTHRLMVEFTESGQMLNDQAIYLDDEPEFALRQVIVADSAGGTRYQFADRDRSFIQAGLSELWPAGGTQFTPNIYDPEIVYPPAGQIVVNVYGANPGSVILDFVGVNRYRVQ